MPQFLNNYTIGDIINALLLFIAIVGIYLTIFQIKQGSSIQKAAFFMCLGYALDLFKDGETLIVHISLLHSLRTGSSRQFLSRLILPGQEACCEREIANH